MKQPKTKRKAAPVCVHCGKPATCLGAYEGAEKETHACDDCCGHGCEDGHCEPLVEMETAT